MALTDNSIGIFNFISLHGEWKPPAEQVLIDQRPGVDGTTITRTGRRGVPFRMVSFVDLAAFSDVPTKLSRYQELITGDPQQIIWAGQDGIAQPVPFQVQVLAVDMIRGGPMHGAFGNALNPPSLAYIECIWTLVAIEI